MPKIVYPIDFDELINILQKNMIIMIGSPASGKSFLSNKLVEKGYIIINQNILKTKSKCIKDSIINFLKNKSIIVDNTNSGRKNYMAQKKY